MTKKYVFIYADDGVSSFSLKETIASCQEELSSFYSIQTINHKILIHSSWERETSLLIIPGGRDIPYDRLLRGFGTHKIRSYVLKRKKVFQSILSILQILPFEKTGGQKS